MKSFIFVVALLGMSQLCFGQCRTPDSTFNNTGIAIAQAANDQDGEAVWVQSDGKILIGGSGDNSNDYDFLISRYQDDGTLDGGFGAAGSVSFPIGAFDELLLDVTQQADGKIIAVGATQMSADSSDVDMAAVRLLPDGMLDNSFAGNGMVTLDFGFAQDVAQGVVMQPDGKILLGGFAASATQFEFAVVRLLPNGNLDSTFSGDGKATIAIGAFEDIGESIALQADGKIVIGGTSDDGTTYSFALARLNTDGSPDLTFNGTGKVTTDINALDDEGRSLAIQADNSIVLAGITDNGTDNDFAAVRYLPSGMLDLTFNQTGIFTADFNGGEDICTSVLVNQQGEILLGGDTEDGTTTQFALLELRPSGVLDTCLNGNGQATYAIQTTEDLCNDMALQPDGKLLMVGESDSGNGNSDLVLLRLDTVEIVIAIDEMQNQRPHIASTLTGFPIPLTHQLTLEYEVDIPTTFSIKLYDLMGNCIANLAPNTFHQSGKHRDTFELSPQIPSGIYFVAFEGRDRFASLKVVK